LGQPRAQYDLEAIAGARHIIGHDRELGDTRGDVGLITTGLGTFSLFLAAWKEKHCAKNGRGKSRLAMHPGFHDGDLRWGGEAVGSIHREAGWGNRE
jgi:hypothetical protein